jgi:uncharacterized membrane-anchored protein YitT (DUF2179 family)
MAKNQKSIRERYDEWCYRHIVWKYIFDYAWTFFVCTVSALVFAIGFKTFMTPNNAAGTGSAAMKLVSGGMSGISQNITLFLEVIFPNWKINEDLSYGILYFVLNIPIFVLAWFGIGKRFAIFTFINVLEVSLFSNLLGQVNWDFLTHVSEFVQDNGALLSRALFAGVCTGLSSALAFKVDISAGGIDVISYYIALKKSTSVGKYTILLNSFTVILFAILTATRANWDSTAAANAFAAVLYSFLYMLVVMLVIDLIHVRNKKCEVKVVTKLDNLSDVLLANIPHGATILKGKGAFSGEEKDIIWMVISSYEVESLVKLVQKEDPRAFIQVTTLNQVYGRFFQRPIK